MFLLGETALPDTTFKPDTRSIWQRGADNRAAMYRLYRATDELQRWRDNFTSEGDARFEAYERRNAAIEKATGVRLANPMRAIGLDDASQLGDAGTDADLIGQVYSTPPVDHEAEWTARLHELEKQHPDQAGAINAARPIQADAIALVKGAEAEKAAAAQALRGSTWGTTFWPTLAGGLRGSLRDPVQVATLPLGYGSAAKTVLGRVLSTMFTEAAINAGIEAGVQVKAEEWRKQTGSAIGAEGIWQQIGLAAAFGGGFGGVIRGGQEALTAAGRMTPRAAELLRKASAGEATADDIAELATEAGVAAAPADLAAYARAVSDDADAEIALAGADARQAESVVQAIEAGRAVPPRFAEQPTPAFSPENFRFFSSRELRVDAKRFQFKEGGDAAGVTDRLKGVTEWKPERAGVTVVWEDDNGRLFVADGHQRAGLARRIAEATGEDVRLPGYVFRAADGFTAEDARVVAALKNIAEGSGSAIDAAKVLRTGRLGVADTGLPPSSALVRDAAGLARLSDDAFAMAVNGVVDPKLAAVAGRLANDERLHAQLLQALKDADARSIGEAESIVKDLLSEPVFTETQIGLFGENELARLLVKEKAQVRQAALKSLKNDRQVFKRLVDEENRIASAGNVLDTAANTERMQGDALLIEAIDSLSRTRGTVADALDAAARAVAGGERAGGAAQGFVELVRAEIERAGGNLGRVGDSRPSTLIDPALAGTRAAEPATPEAQAAAAEALRAAIDNRQFALETTDAGEQALIPGVEPMTTRQRLEAEAAKPMQGGDLPPGGLFGPERDQLDLMDAIPAGTNAEGRLLMTTHAELTLEAERAGMLADLIESCKG